MVVILRCAYGKDVCVAKMCMYLCTEVKLVNLPHLSKTFHLSNIFLNYISS